MQRAAVTATEGDRISVLETNVENIYRRLGSMEQSNAEFQKAVAGSLKEIQTTVSSSQRTDWKALTGIFGVLLTVMLALASLAWLMINQGDDFTRRESTSAIVALQSVVLSNTTTLEKISDTRYSDKDHADYVAYEEKLRAIRAAHVDKELADLVKAYERLRDRLDAIDHRAVIERLTGHRETLDRHEREIEHLRNWRTP